MHINLAEHILSKEVEDALMSIKELKNISEGTKVSKIILNESQFFNNYKINNFFKGFY